MRRPRSIFARGGLAMAGSGGLILGVITMAPGVASASTPSCGSTVTSSVTLSGNMNCSSYTTGPALIIGAAGVTVNLNGYKILGPGAGAATEGIVDISSDGASGAPFASLVVEDGSISNFTTDIDVEGSSGALLTGTVVENVKTTNNAVTEGEAFYGEYLAGASIHNNSVSDANVGIEVDDSTSSTVSDNKMVRPGTDGFFDGGGDSNSWSHNQVTAASGDGFDLRNTTGDVVESNSVTGTGSANGVYDTDSSGINISKNVLDDLYDGVDQYSDLSGAVSHNTGSDDEWGIYTDSPSGMTFQGNKFNHGQYGIETDFPISEALLANTTNYNSEAGVLIYTNEEADPYTAPEVKNNTADNNRYGLYSQVATTGNGNDADHNTAVNCYNVYCGAGGPRAGSVAPPVHRTPKAAQGLLGREAKF